MLCFAAFGAIIGLREITDVNNDDINVNAVVDVVVIDNVSFRALICHSLLQTSSGCQSATFTTIWVTK